MFKTDYSKTRASHRPFSGADPDTSIHWILKSDLGPSSTSVLTPLLSSPSTNPTVLPSKTYLAAGPLSSISPVYWSAPMAPLQATRRLKQGGFMLLALNPLIIVRKSKLLPSRHSLIELLLNCQPHLSPRLCSSHPGLSSQNQKAPLAGAACCLPQATRPGLHRGAPPCIWQSPVSFPSPGPCVACRVFPDETVTCQTWFPSSQHRAST